MSQIKPLFTLLLLYLAYFTFIWDIQTTMLQHIFKQLPKSEVLSLFPLLMLHHHALQHPILPVPQ
jgi:hypothetical protein